MYRGKRSHHLNVTAGFQLYIGYYYPSTVVVELVGNPYLCNSRFGSSLFQPCLLYTSDVYKRQAMGKQILYLNGKRIQEHLGGYLPFTLDLTANGVQAGDSRCV